MFRPTSRKPIEPRSILVLIVQGMGDLVLATPALRQIRQRFPDSRLTVAGRADLIDILANEPYIDRLLPLKLPPRLDSVRSLYGVWQAAACLRRRRDDLLINLTTLLTAATYLKCSLFNRLCRPARLLQGQLGDCVRLLPWPRERVRYRHPIHEAEMKFRVLRGLAGEPAVIRPKLTLPATPSPIVSRLAALARTKRLIGIFTGGARQSRQWPLHRFVECAQLLRLRGDCRPVLLGAACDLPAADAIARSFAPGDVVNLAGKVAVRELPEVIAALHALLTNDSGLMHVAAAVETPLVAICGPESPQRYRPIAEPSRATDFYGFSTCRPCQRAQCLHRACMSGISPARVVEAVYELLNRHAGFPRRGVTTGVCDTPDLDPQEEAGAHRVGAYA